jgi:CHAT domain-containing protein
VLKACVFAAILVAFASGAAAQTSATDAKEIQIRKMLAESERKFGAESDPVLNDLEILTTYLMTQGRYTDAEPVGRRAVALAEKLDASGLSVALHSLGYVLASEGRETEAEPLFRRALEIEEKASSPDEATILSDKRALATILVDGGRYAEAEEFLRAIVAADKAAAKPDMFEHEDLSDLGRAIAGQGRYAEAAVVLRQQVAMVEKSYGADSPYLAPDLGELAEVLANAGQSAEADGLFRRAVALAEKGGGPEASETGTALRRYAEFEATQGRLDQGEADFRRGLAIHEKAYGPSDPRLLIDLQDLGLFLGSRGRREESETLLRRALAIDEATQGPDSMQAADGLGELALSFEVQGRMDEAEPLYRRALAIVAKARPSGDPEIIRALARLGEIQRLRGDLAAAEATLRSAVATGKAANGTDEDALGEAERDLASTLADEGRYAEAEPMMRAALAQDETTAPSGAGGYLTLDLATLSSALEAQHKYPEALELARRSLAVDQRLNDGDQLAPFDRIRVGTLEAEMGTWDLAAADLRTACGSELVSMQRLAGGLPTEQDLRTSRSCSLLLADSLVGAAAKPTKAGDRDKAFALLAEAFTAAQQSGGSRAGEAMAQASAQALAQRSGVGAEAQDYEHAVADMGELNKRFAAAAGAQDLQTEQSLAVERAAVQARLASLRKTIEAKAPAYWDYRSPAPLSVDDLQATAGDAGKLLRANEALVFWVTSPGDSTPLIFAVSKASMATSVAPVSGDEIKQQVENLRWRIDPRGFSRSGARVEGDRAEPFDRATAHALYVELLGAPQIQHVINAPEIDTLIIVPTGPLTSLPPGLLVVDPPKGSDSDPAALAATHWLIRDKAVSVLPTVASLRTLRVLMPATRGAPDLKLLALADPDFGGSGAIPTPNNRAQTAPSPLPTARSLERDGRGTDGVKSLPPLYGTLAEGKAIAGILDPSDPLALLLGPDATKTNLLRLDGEGGRLRRARVVAFSTHGLLTGDFTGLTEPALALAAPPKTGADPRDDGLLKASDAAALTLSADWVVLSACNTGAGDGRGAEGLSGLARAFFHAGATSLLVSHWRVDDAATGQLIADTLRFQQEGASKAKALQAAMLKMLADPSRAEPRFWAPFVVVGEAE